MILFEHEMFSLFLDKGLPRESYLEMPCTQRKRLLKYAARVREKEREAAESKQGGGPVFEDVDLADIWGVRALPEYRGRTER